MSKDQTAGRGQRGATWLSKPNTNVTASFIYSPVNFEIKDQFLLTILSSLAVYNVIQQLSLKQVRIKWPNDIYIGDKKVAGILIENKIGANLIKHVIFGIGINVYQKQFEPEIAYKTTSLSIENNKLDLTILDIVKLIQDSLIKEFAKIDQLNRNDILKDYNTKLFRKNSLSSFIIENKTVQGIIKEVTLDGLIHIQIDNQINKFDLKDIAYII